MLVLSRQKNEKICIGDDIEVMVVDIRGDKVRLGTTAPKHVQVDREEVREKKLQNPPTKESDIQLHTLRDMGFTPYTIAMHQGSAIELISYPYKENETCYIKARLEIGEPTSMVTLPTSEVWTAEAVESADNRGQMALFIRVIARYLKTRNI